VPSGSVLTLAVCFLALARVIGLMSASLSSATTPVQTKWTV